MKLVIERKKLLPALSAVMGAVSRKSTLPILTFLHVSSDGEVLTIMASNLELTLRVNVPDISCSSFEMLWPGRRMLEIVKSYPEDAMIGIAQDEPGKIVVKCGRSRFNLAILDPQDYPIIDRVEFDKNFSISQAIMQSCLHKTDFAMAKQDVRYYLNSLLFHGVSNRVNFVATDGHRLAKTDCNVFVLDKEDVFSDEWQAIIPSETIGEIKKACTEGECGVSVSDNMMRFNFSNRELIIKLIDGKFPDYKRVIPKQFKREAIIDRVLLLEAVERVRLVLDGSEGVAMHFTKGLLTIGGGIEDNVEDQIDTNYQEDDIVIGINADYLIDVLRVIDSRDVKLLFGDSMDGVKIMDSDGSYDDYIIMPMRL
jgi:DNA polymerase-3 subunit beta